MEYIDKTFSLQRHQLFVVSNYFVLLIYKLGASIGASRAASIRR
jgi:hypothetical protein